MKLQFQSSLEYQTNDLVCPIMQPKTFFIGEIKGRYSVIRSFEKEISSISPDLPVFQVRENLKNYITQLFWEKIQ